MYPVLLGSRHAGRLGHVPGDGLPFTVEVGGQPDRRGLAGLASDLLDVTSGILRDHILGLEVMVDVNAELALAGILRKVSDVAVGSEHLEVLAQVALDRPRLCRRLDDHEVLRHRRESSTGVRRFRRARSGPRSPRASVRAGAS